MQISKLNVLLTGSIAGFSAVMAAGKQEIDGFGSHFKSAAGSIAGIGATLGAGALVSGLEGMVKSSFETMAATDRLANSLGLTTESLSELHYAAKQSGVEAETLDKAIGKLDKNLNAAAQGGTGSAAKAFETLGLNASELINERPQDVLGEVASAMNQIENPAQRAAVAQEIFGKAAVQLLPLLSKGAGGIAELSAEADRLGVSFTGLDATKVEEANKAFSRLGSVIQGAMNKLAVELAPFLEAAANKLTELATSGEGMGGHVVNAFGSVVKAMASAADYIAIVEAGWQMLRAGASYAIGGILDGIGYVLDALDWLLKKLGKTATGWGDTAHALSAGFKATGKEAFEKAGESWEKFASGENSAKAAKFFDGIKTGAAQAAAAIDAAKPKLGGIAEGVDEGAKKIEKAAEKLAELQKQIDQFDLSKSEKLADDIGRMGGSPEQIQSAKAMAEQLDSMEAAKKIQEEMAKDAESLWKATQSPLEKYNAELEKLSTLYDEGLLSAETFHRAQDKAGAELEKAAKGKDDKAPELLQAGSASAASFIAKYQASGGDAQGEMLKRQDRGNGFLQQIAENTKSQGNGGQLYAANFNEN